MQTISFVGVRGSFGLNSSRKRQPKAILAPTSPVPNPHFQSAWKLPPRQIASILALAAFLTPSAILAKTKAPIPFLKHCQGRFPLERIWEACDDARNTLLDQEEVTGDRELVLFWKCFGLRLPEILQPTLNTLCQQAPYRERTKDFAILVKGPDEQLLGIASREHRALKVYSTDLAQIASTFQAKGQVAAVIHLNQQKEIATVELLAHPTE